VRVRRFCAPLQRRIGCGRRGAERARARGAGRASRRALPARAPHTGLHI